MNDLVERLRKCPDPDKYGLVYHAADRIEVLEAALRDVIAECSYRSAPIKTPQSTEDIFMIARAALDKDAGK